MAIRETIQGYNPSLASLLPSGEHARLQGGSSFAPWVATEIVTARLEREADELDKLEHRPVPMSIRARNASFPACENPEEFNAGLANSAELPEIWHIGLYRDHNGQLTTCHKDVLSELYR